MGPEPTPSVQPPVPPTPDSSGGTLRQVGSGAVIFVATLLLLLGASTLLTTAPRALRFGRGQPIGGRVAAGAQRESATHAIGDGVRLAHHVRLARLQRLAGPDPGAQRRPGARRRR